MKLDNSSVSLSAKIELGTWVSSYSKDTSFCEAVETMFEDHLTKLKNFMEEKRKTMATFFKRVMEAVTDECTMAEEERDEAYEQVKLIRRALGETNGAVEALANNLNGDTMPIADVQKGLSSFMQTNESELRNIEAHERVRYIRDNIEIVVKHTNQLKRKMKAVKDEGTMAKEKRDEAYEQVKLIRRALRETNGAVEALAKNLNGDIMPIADVQKGLSSFIQTKKSELRKIEAYERVGHFRDNIDIVVKHINQEHQQLQELRKNVKDGGNEASAGGIRGNTLKREPVDVPGIHEIESSMFSSMKALELNRTCASIEDALTKQTQLLGQLKRKLTRTQTKTIEDDIELKKSLLHKTSEERLQRMHSSVNHGNNARQQLPAQHDTGGPSRTYNPAPRNAQRNSDRSPKRNVTNTFRISHAPNMYTRYTGRQPIQQ